MQVNLERGVQRLSLVAGAVGLSISLLSMPLMLTYYAILIGPWAQLLLPVLLALGFFLPWAIVKALGWAVAGFLPV